MSPMLPTSLLITQCSLLLCNTSGIKAATDVWLEVWESARRALSVPACVRAACHTLNAILQTRILGPAMTGGLVDVALFGGGNNGPCILTDTALHMLATTLRLNLFDDDKRFETFCLKVIGWLSLQWTLRKSSCLRFRYSADSCQPPILIASTMRTLPRTLNPSCCIHCLFPCAGPSTRPLAEKIGRQLILYGGCP